MQTISFEVLDEAVEHLVEEVQPEEMYLFGSHAWGKPANDSDVDLSVSFSKAMSLRRAARNAPTAIGGVWDSPKIFSLAHGQK